MNPGSAHPKADLLYRLHQNKQRQLLDARRQGNALASSLLEAEARALGEALANLNRRCYKARRQAGHETTQTFQLIRNDKTITKASFVFNLDVIRFLLL